MSKFIVFTFAMLAWAFYEMSGGADFVPERRETAALAPAPQAIEVQVTRAANTGSLVALPQEEDTPEVTPASFTAPEADLTDTLTEEEAETLAAAAAQQDSVDAPLDLRAVAGDWVNMRSGSGTEFTVLETLRQGTEVEVLEISENGWARLRVVETGLEGWMAERLLADL